MRLTWLLGRWVLFRIPWVETISRRVLYTLISTKGETIRYRVGSYALHFNFNAASFFLTCYYIQVLELLAPMSFLVVVFLSVTSCLLTSRWNHTNLKRTIPFWLFYNWIVSLLELSEHLSCNSVVFRIALISIQWSFLLRIASSASSINRWPENT